MLKVKTQLSRALQYQAVIGGVRGTGHFDDSAKDQVGPPSRGMQRLAPEERRVVSIGSTTPNLKVKIDPDTGDFVSYFETACQ